MGILQTGQTYCEFQCLIFMELANPKVPRFSNGSSDKAGVRGVENGRGGVTWASEGRLPKPGSQISA